MSLASGHSATQFVEEVQQKRHVQVALLRVACFGTGEHSKAFAVRGQSEKPGPRRKEWLVIPQVGLGVDERIASCRVLRDRDPVVQGRVEQLPPVSRPRRHLATASGDLRFSARTWKGPDIYF